MILINNNEIIKKSGDFKLDKIWVKTFSVNQVTQTGGKIELTIEYVTYSELDNGDPIFDLSDIKKVQINDLEEYMIARLGDSPAEGTQILGTYNETQQAIVHIINYFMPTMQTSFVQTLGV